MSLLKTLTDYFNDSDNGDDAMEGGLKGYTHRKTKEYSASPFEQWAEGYGISVEDADRYGGEGSGTYYRVYKFTGQGEEVYLKFYGYYQSYDGATYEGFNQVQPVTKTVTVYE